MPSINIAIIAVTCIITYVGWQNQVFLRRFMLKPYQNIRNNEWINLISSGFLHADAMHLLFNMLALFFFGDEVLNVFLIKYGLFVGNFLFVLFYITAIFFANIYPTIKNKDNKMYSAFGASGAVSAILYFFIILNPWHNIYIYFIKMPAIVFGILYLVFETVMAKRAKDNIGHDAHISGAIYGIIVVFIFFWKEGISFFEKIINY